MNLTVELHIPNQSHYAWPITVDDFFEFQDVLTTILGKPTVTRLGEPYDLDRHIEIRLGEVGVPRREITIEPEPEKVPEPIKVPEPAVPVPA